MYSFAQRSDTRVVDEPLYAHYLRVSGADHPLRAEVLASQEQDGEKVVREVIDGAGDASGAGAAGAAPGGAAVVFFKQMAHHLVELDRRFLARAANVLLTRDPREMLPSLAENLSIPTLRDTGYAAQTQLLRELRALGQDPPVLDARELLLDPESVLTQLCDRLGLRFERAMLAWKPGGRPEDGVWAPQWYGNVHRSSGFAPYKKKEEPFPRRLEPLLAECLPHYEELSRAAIWAKSR